MPTKSHETLQSPEKSPKKSNYLRIKAKRSPSKEHFRPKKDLLDKKMTSLGKSQSREIPQYPSKKAQNFEDSSHNLSSPR